MTTQELYNKVLAKEVTQQKFLYEVRRDINLPFITSSNNFKDTVQILKNKGMISEKKLSTGKQEVEIFAKTIDMVNPYEYTRGMNYELDVVIDSMGNRIADNAGDSMHIEDLTKDDVLKAQKKVLKNLTKNPQYYQQKLIPQMEGETELPVEVNAKSIEALKKKAGKIIREHGEDYEAVSKVMGNVSQLEEEELEEQGIDSEHVVKFKLAGNNYYNEATFIGTIPVNQLRTKYREGNEIEDYDGNSKKIVDVQIETRPRAEINEMKKTGLAAEYQEAMKDYFNSYSKESEKEALDRMNRIARQLDLGSDIANIDIKDLEQVKENRSERNTNYITALGMYKNAKGTADEKMAREKLKKAAEDIGLDLPIFDKPIKETNYGTGIKKDEQIAAKKMANKRESIYEKYAKQYEVDVNELKDRLEAYKLKQEEDVQLDKNDPKTPETAAKIEKENPDAIININ